VESSLKPFVQLRKGQSRHERTHRGSQLRLPPADLRQRDCAARTSDEEPAPNGIPARRDLRMHIDFGGSEAKQARAEAE
jgi:hypothetical protein